jgi:hypothetical protein
MILIGEIAVAIKGVGVAVPLVLVGVIVAVGPGVSVMPRAIKVNKLLKGLLPSSP